jgi:hypothetical protein
MANATAVPAATPTVGPTGPQSLLIKSLGPPPDVEVRTRFGGQIARWWIGGLTLLKGICPHFVRTRGAPADAERRLAILLAVAF